MKRYNKWTVQELCDKKETKCERYPQIEFSAMEEFKIVEYETPSRTIQKRD